MAKNNNVNLKNDSNLLLAKPISPAGESEANSEVSSLSNVSQSSIVDKNVYSEAEVIDQFVHYLAGLIEGDGYISITNENIVILGITFNIKDRPLAEKILQILLKGFIASRKTNCVELRISDKETLIRVINLINGKFRTPIIDQLYKIIDWLNNKYLMNIIKLPLDNSSILSNSWVSGFIDADGSFYIRFTNQIFCKFSLEQRMIYPKTNESFFDILNKICLILNVKLAVRTR